MNLQAFVQLMRSQNILSEVNNYCIIRDPATVIMSEDGSIAMFVDTKSIGLDNLEEPLAIADITKFSNLLKTVNDPELKITDTNINVISKDENGKKTKFSFRKGMYDVLEKASGGEEGYKGLIAKKDLLNERKETDHENYLGDIIITSDNIKKIINYASIMRLDDTKNVPNIKLVTKGGKCAITLGDIDDDGDSTQVELETDIDTDVSVKFNIAVFKQIPKVTYKLSLFKSNSGDMIMGMFYWDTYSILFMFSNEKDLYK